MSEPEMISTHIAGIEPSLKPAGATRTGMIVLAKMAVAAVIVFWLIRSNRLDLRAFAGVQGDAAAIALVVLGVLGVFVGQLLLALRLFLLLRRAEVRVSVARAIGVTLLGSLVGIALPGLVGGDVVRAVYLCADAVGRRANAVCTVLLDRVLGLYSLFLVGALAWVVLCCSTQVEARGPWLWTVPIIALAMTIALWLAGWTGWQTWPVVAPIWQRVPANLRNMVGVLQDCLGQPRLLVTTIGLSVLNHALVICTFVIAAVLLGNGLPWVLHFVLSPLAMTMNMVAITPGGVGLAEGAFSLLYESAGSRDGANLGLLGRLVQYATFALSGSGAILWVRMRASR